MIGEDIKKSVFRDTKKFYSTADENVYGEQLIQFVKDQAGTKILDIGCATGNYCDILSRDGFDMYGVDINKEYVDKAVARGIKAFHIQDTLPFADATFDSAIMFEVLEHLTDPAPVIAEARRVIKKNILFTVPNSGGIADLQHRGLLFEHFADMDHKNFFTKESLFKLLSPYFSHIHITEGDPIHPSVLFKSKLLQLIVKILCKVGIARPRFYFRLYVVAEP